MLIEVVPLVGELVQLTAPQTTGALNDIPLVRPVVSMSTETFIAFPSENVTKFAEAVLQTTLLSAFQAENWHVVPCNEISPSNEFPILIETEQSNKLKRSPSTKRTRFPVDGEFR
jgi:hypothetical protein